MANIRTVIISVKNVLNNYRCNFTYFKREYSVFPKHYIQPIFRKDEQEELFQSEEAKKVIHQQIKPALVTDTCSEFYDPRVLKFINTLMRGGDKSLAEEIVFRTFGSIKRIQVERYHRATTEDKNNIELDPYTIFHCAVTNCMPVLHLIPARKGGITYQVPVPITDVRARHLSMKWLIQAAREKHTSERYFNALAKELVAASQNQGRAVKWKQELHKRCQDNRAYAHFRWI